MLDVHQDSICWNVHCRRQLHASSGSDAAPLPVDVTIMKSTLDDNALQVRYGWGYCAGWGGGYRGLGYGYRGYGYRRWGAGAVVAGAVVGGAIASSSYYGGYPYYGGGAYGGGYPAYAQEYGSDYCPPAYGGYGYGGYYARRITTPAGRSGFEIQ
jgi:hypothetical protein